MAVESQDMESGILAVNDAFYSAFTTRDIDAMEKLWATSATVTCVHPGWNAARGREPVMISWQSILSTPQSHQGSRPPTSRPTCWVTASRT